MGEDGKESSARSASARTPSAQSVAPVAPRPTLEQSAELDVDALLRDVDDFAPESGALDANASANVALTRPSATAGVLHALGVPATPMAVPVLHPPSAMPPPLRPSSAPYAAVPTRAHLPPPAPVPKFGPHGGSTALAPEAAPFGLSQPGVTSPLLNPSPARAGVPAASPAQSARSVAPPEFSAEAPAGGPTSHVAHPAVQAPSRFRWWWLAVPAAIAALTLVILSLQPQPAGALRINVSAPNGQAVARLRVYVDDQLRCSYSPCQVEGLSVGTHDIRAEAPEYVSSERHPVLLSEGIDASYGVYLQPVAKFARLSVSARGNDLTVELDDKSFGPPPVEISDVEPGSHTLKISGHRFEPLIERVQLAPEQHLNLGPLKPKVARGLLTIRAGAGAAEASVTLNGKPITELPATVELPGQQSHVLVAQRPDFDRFETVITFPDGKAEVSVDIVLLEADADPVAATTSSTPGGADQRNASSTDRSGDPRSALSAATLNMNSIPSSKVVLDGRVLGETPQVGVKTSAGLHSVVFVHPERGTRRVKVRVGSGQAKNVSVRF